MPENKEQIATLQKNYANQMQASRYEKMLNSLNPAQREAVKLLAQLSNTLPGKLVELQALVGILKSINSNIK
jgi:CRISPR/Cas system-associated endoribonuclease Cas2